MNLKTPIEKSTACLSCGFHNIGLESALDMRSNDIKRTLGIKDNQISWSIVLIFKGKCGFELSTTSTTLVLLVSSYIKNCSHTRMDFPCNCKASHNIDHHSIGQVNATWMLHSTKSPVFQKDCPESAATSRLFFSCWIIDKL